MKRNCPKCNKELIYTHPLSYARACKANSICGGCAKQGKPPPNKGKHGLQVAWNKGRPFGRLYSTCLVHANKKRGIPVELTYEQFLEFTNIKECHYCGQRIDWHPYRQGIGYNLDRLDASAGYTKQNCVVCCYICNRMKFRMSELEFIGHCRIIAGKHENVY